MPNAKNKPNLIINFPLCTIFEVEKALQHLVNVGGNDRDNKYRAKLMDLLIDSRYPWLVLEHLKELQGCDILLTRFVSIRRLKRITAAIIQHGTYNMAIELLGYLLPQNTFVNERIALLKKVLRYPKDKWMTASSSWEFAELVSEERAMLIEAVKRSGRLEHARLMQSSRFGIMSNGQADEVRELVRKLESKATKLAAA